MNRSILIVICDFLLVSLLAFSTMDVNKLTDNSAQTVKLEMATNQPESKQDLGAVMRLALEEERKQRDVLLGELSKSKDALGQQQALLTEREQQAQTLQQQLDSREQQAQKLQSDLSSREQEAARLQAEQAALQQKYAAAQTNLQTLDEQLQSRSVESVVSKERLAAMEAEMKKQQEQAAAMQQQMASLERSNNAVLLEKQRLSGQLDVAEAERRAATAQVGLMQSEVKAERDEKAKLAAGVQALASRSDQLAQEIREHRPLAPNTIFSEFVSNRVEARFYAQRSGLLGMDANRRRETETVLVADGTNILALCHVQDTPLALSSSGTEWEGLTGTLGRGTAMVPINSMMFYLWDPRMVWMPVTEKQAKELGVKVYTTSSDPYKFQDAVVVGAREGYYGECKFQIDLTTPQYVKMDRNSLKGLFGQFNPSRGDLVFSKMGELLGIMVNNTYCLMIRDFNSAASLQFSLDVRAQHTGQTLSQLNQMVDQMPGKLQ